MYSRGVVAGAWAKGVGGGDRITRAGGLRAGGFAHSSTVFPGRDVPGTVLRSVFILF